MAWEKERARARKTSQPISTGSALRFTTTAGLTKWSRRWSGEINVYNLLAAWCAAYSVGIGPEVIAQRHLRAARAVPGRFERVDVGQPFLVVVDYAHTDDALRNAHHDRARH